MTIKEFKGTPGPWEVGGGENGGCESHVYCDDLTGSAVCSLKLDYVYRNKEVKQANARLIAAAPELLEEHQEWSALIGQVYVMLQQGQADDALALIDEIETIDFSSGKPVAVSSAINKALGGDNE